MSPPKAHRGSPRPVDADARNAPADGSVDHYTSAGIDHLLNLDKLLNAAHDIMKQEPSLDREAFEHLRRLRVKVRFAISSATLADRATEPLQQAPRLWRDRAAEERDPLQFLITTYGP